MDQVLLVLPDLGQIHLHLVVAMVHRLTFFAFLGTIYGALLVSDSTFLGAASSLVVGSLLLFLNRVASGFLKLSEAHLGPFGVLL